jgi:nucleoside 2-deoxyribosyltransferase
MALTMHQKPGKEERMAEWQKCPVCGSPAKEMRTIPKEEVNYIGIDCLRCGYFTIVFDYCRILQSAPNAIDKEKGLSLSHHIFDNNNMTLFINRNFVDNFKSKNVPNLKEKTDLFIERIASTNPFAGHHIDLNEDNIKAALDILEACDYGSVKINESVKPVFKYFAHCFIYDTKEFRYIWKSLCDQNLLSEERPKKEITPAGWEYIQQLRARNPKSKKAFVAMWFDDQMKDICENFISKAAYEAGGFTAEAVYQDEHNNDINDQIIANINQSRFMIADFTGNRAGVYYEAGYARGLNIPVIYTCREDWFNTYVNQTVDVIENDTNTKKEIMMMSRIHFDIDHRNFIIWENGEDLKEKLINRINATINRPDQI